MADSRPLVSVIIPAFNAEQTIERSIASGRTVPGVEVIVVDDGSADETSVIAARLGVRVIHQANSGASRARRRGLEESSAEFIVFLDADDEVIAEGVRRSLEILQEDEKVVVAAGAVLGIMPNGSSTKLSSSFHSYDTLDLVTIGHGPWPPAAQVIRRSALAAAARLPISELTTKFAEDYEMLVRLSLVGNLRRHEVLAARYQMFAGKSSRRPSAAIGDKERIRRHYSQSLNIDVRLMTAAEVSAAGQVRAARSERANGRWHLAAFHLVRAALAAPAWFSRKLIRRRDDIGKNVVAS